MALKLCTHVCVDIPLAFGTESGLKQVTELELFSSELLLN